MRILAIRGSLRASSSNRSALEAAAMLAPAGMAMAVYEGLAHLPHFNADLDTAEPPDAVLTLRREIGLADGLVISSPEYAHGVPGSLKNALDWLVASFEFPGKPVMLINASPPGRACRSATARDPQDDVGAAHRHALGRPAAARAQSHGIRHRVRPRALTHLANSTRRFRKGDSERC
jgi:NAD(P)H-dependent FMN reductase